GGGQSGTWRVLFGSAENPRPAPPRRQPEPLRIVAGWTPPGRSPNRPPMISSTDSSKGGIPLGLAAYAIWGFMPLYFKLLAGVQPTEIVAHRIIWSLILLALLATLWRRWSGIRAALGTGRVLLTLIVTACLIAVNWLVYIYA